MVKYLSSEWLDEVRAAMDADRTLAVETAETELVLQQVVTGAPNGDVAYFITFDNGTVHVQSGVASQSDVAFTQDYKTALEVHLGTLNALMAFQEGRISIKGDVTALTANQAAIGALDQAFRAVKNQTTY
ncbi:MAG: SCP2 sterol-binding domain-containing protein [Actinobacteria bacterium]|nr:SCP2 sterol-binding domain-containing protein [Actinomycetota bacterium]